MFLLKSHILLFLGPFPPSDYHLHIIFFLFYHNTLVLVFKGQVDLKVLEIFVNAPRFMPSSFNPRKFSAKKPCVKALYLKWITRISNHIFV